MSHTGQIYSGSQTSDDTLEAFQTLRVISMVFEANNLNKVNV